MNDYQLWFASANLSYKIKKNLVNKYGDAENIWYAFINDEIFRNKSALVNSKIKFAWDDKKIDNIKSIIERENIRTCVVNDSIFPEKLKVYDDCPYMLFYKGNINYAKMISVAIVGSRKSTQYGENITKILAESFAKNNIVVISGMARGIDSCAHSEILRCQGITCAILGSGIDVIYPKENKLMYEEIISHGCIISQFLPGTRPYAYNFPVRNKIISALSDLIIVVEATNKSGSLITAGSALEQGKDVIAVPGDIFSEQSKGCNKLIKDGAYVLTTLEDVYNLLAIDDFLYLKSYRKSVDILEEQIYSIILNKPIHINDLLKKIDININKLYETLFELEFQNKIKHLAGDFYVRSYKQF